MCVCVLPSAITLLVYNLMRVSLVTGYPLPVSLSPPPFPLKERMRLEREAATRLLEEETEVRLSCPCCFGIAVEIFWATLCSGVGLQLHIV